MVESNLYAQPACPSVSVTPNNISICSGCTTLTATVQGSVATTSYSVGPTAYTPFPYNVGAAVLVNIDDTWSSAINIPFCFQFYGNTYNQLLIGSNELITFDLTNAGGYCSWPLTSSSGIPDATLPTNSVMGPYQDIDPTNMGNIYWQVVGTAPCRAFVVSFYKIPYYGDPNSISTGDCPNAYFATSQIVLYETTNIIDIYVKDKNSCSGWNGGLAIEGIQDASGTSALTVAGRNNTIWTATNDAYRFTPTGAPDYTLTWYAPPNTPIGTALTVTVCPTTTTTYTATVVNNTCSTPITVSDMATVTFGSGAMTMTMTPTSCSGNTGTATATSSGGSPPFTYLWTPTGQNTQTATGLSAGTYSATITDANGCSSTQAITVTNLSNLSATTSSSPTSCSSNSGTATATPTGGTAPYTYVWTPTGQITQTATGLSAGTYSVAISDANGCITSATDTVTSQGGITSVSTTVTPTSCSSNSGTATAIPLGGTAPYIYMWTPTGQNTQTATGLGVGTYTAIVSDANGCVLSEVAVVTAPNGISSVNTSATQPSCNGGSNGTATATPTGGVAPYTYLWNNGQITQIATGFPTGTFSVTVTDANGCTFPASVNVTQPTAVILSSATIADTCGKNEGSATATVSGGITPYTYVWLTSPIQSTANVVGLSAGTYSCIVSDANGCTAMVSAQVGNIPGPTANFTPDPQTVDILDANVFFQDMSSSATTWQWNFGDGAPGSNIENPSHTYQNEGTYIVTLIITNAQGCVDTVSETVVVEGYSTFYVPNTFTPNGDGINDFFTPVFSRIEGSGFSMTIFDRWGNELFKTTTLGQYWDGKMKDGKIVQEDVYVYVITYRDIKLKDHKLIGNVNVVK